MRRRFTMLPQAGDVEIMPNYCCFKALEDGMVVSLALSSSSVDYCIDNGVWKTLIGGQSTEAVNAGQVIAFASTSVPTFKVVEKRFKLEGNVMSLIYGHNAKGATSMGNQTFQYLFDSQYFLIEISDYFLPATTLTQRCYAQMFASCEQLEKAPKILPATTLTEGCYLNMFRACPKLKTAPILPAPVLAKGCYNYLFLATSITEVVCLAETWDSSNCSLNWMISTPPNGVFYKSATATWEEYGSSAIPDGWEVRIYEGE